MGNDGTDLGDRMKMYEAATGSVLPRYLPVIIRVDGRAFHTFLRRAAKPYDKIVGEHMGYVAQALCAEVEGAVFAYQQSDEVSVLVCAYTDFRTEPWFGGRVQKIASTSAAIATQAFINYTYAAELLRSGTFDARVFALPNAVEVANYFVWRQRDASRNSRIMAARAHFSHGEIQNLDGLELEEKLLRERGITWDHYPEAFRYGQVCERREDDTVNVRWRVKAAPAMTAASGGWLARHIPPLPSFGEDAPSGTAVEAAVEEYFPATDA
jgi:tRNA(His) 5'-end guanylyltransferase